MIVLRNSMQLLYTVVIHTLICAMHVTAIIVLSKLLHFYSMYPIYSCDILEYKSATGIFYCLILLRIYRINFLIRF